VNRDLHAYSQFFRPGFLPWLNANWAIYHAFEQQALTLIRKEWKRFSARTIVEELRHYTRHREAGRCSFKINDHHAPDMARVFTILHPQYARFWEYRRPDWTAFLQAIATTTTNEKAP